MVNKENGFTMVPATTAQVTKNNELYDKFYASHRVAFVSKAESDSMDARRYAMRALTSSTDWQEFVGQTMSANIEIAKAKQSIQENNPEADEIALESLYDADKTIKDLTLEVSLIFQQQNAQMEQIKENNPILGPKTADDADTAKRADGKPSGVGGIIVKSTTSANITTDFIGQTSENTVIGDDAFALDRVKTFVDKRGGTLTQEEMGDLITASKGASEIEAYLVETQGYEPEDSSGVKPDVAFAPTRNKYGSLGLASSDSLKSLLANARSRQEETKIKRKAYNDMSREERSTHRETGVYPTHIQKKIDEGTI